MVSVALFQHPGIGQHREWVSIPSSNTEGNSVTPRMEQTLLPNTTGNYNTALGVFTGVSIGNLTNATAPATNVQQ